MSVSVCRCREVRKPVTAFWWEPIPVQIIIDQVMERAGRVDANEILDGFYVGGLSAAIDTAWLQQTHICTIINVCSARYVPPPDVIYMNVPLRDGNEKDLRPAFEKVYPLLRAVAVKREHWAQKSDEEKERCDVPPSCLIHCQHGKSRSVALLLMFMMRWYREPLEYAFSAMVAKRDVLSPPLFNFQLQLTAFERDEFGIEFNSVADWVGSCAKDGARPKRKRLPVISYSLE